MALSRRAILARLASTGVAAGLMTPSAFAETTQYRYDGLGRLVLVIFSDGSSVQYNYDAAGNRTSVVRSSTTPEDTFTATIQITGTSGVNLRTLADAAGYTENKQANVTFQLGSGVTLTGANGAPAVHAIDSGNWPYTIYQTLLTLQISGSATGGGGNGGGGNGNAGGAGGDAVHCRLPMTVVVNSGGLLRGGGGGGGGGGRARINVGGEWEIYGGSGGGGGQPNGSGGAAGLGPNGNGSPGTAGSTSAPGNGGVIGTGGTGGNGGAYGAAGQAGESAFQAGGAGGTAGYGIRKNGHAVTVTNNGTITGTVG